MPIRVLAPDVAAQIAAGEVVERPVSVVKELVENSIDAGANRVTVEIKGGGVELIRVIDDGVGIPSDQVALAFQRHATSKLTASEQLESIQTLGFRGEALPSIAAVSRTTVQTRPPAETAGFRIALRWGETAEAGPHGCPPGTTVEVSDLFGNLPARRKFLRSSSREAHLIHELVGRYALAFPELRFQFVNEGRTSFTTSGQGDPLEALAVVYGAEAAANMLQVHREDPQTGYLVEGFASSPNVSRASRSFLTFFVNRRWIQNRRLMFAVEEAYSGLLQVKRYPLAAINIAVPYGEVDVNSHPAKREVRFRNENLVFSTVQRGVRAALIVHSPVPSVTLPEGSGFPLRQPGGVSFVGGGGNGMATDRRPTSPPSEPFVPTETPLIGRPTTPLRVVGQLKLTYIVAEGASGMYLVDQHAAHERVIFDRLCQQRDERGTLSQPLLAPISIELTPSQSETLESNLPSVLGYGFDVESFGDRGYLLRAVPLVLTTEDPARALVDILDMTALEGLVRHKEDVTAASIACHGAVRAGKQLAEPEMVALLEQLEATPNPHTCPHGRPTMVHFSSYLMEREFGRR